MGNMRPENARRFMKWFAIVLFGMGLLIILGGISLFFRSSSSKGWPTVKGVIIESRIHSYKKTESRSKNSNDRITDPDTIIRTFTAYEPFVRYKYTANGMQFEQKTIGFFVGYDEIPEFAQGYVDKYPVGKEVRVFYNPGNPSEAVLEPGTNVLAIIVMLAVGTLPCLISLAPLYRWRQLLRKEEQRQKKREENAAKRKRIAEEKAR